MQIVENQVKGKDLSFEDIEPPLFRREHWDIRQRVQMLSLLVSDPEPSPACRESSLFLYPVRKNCRRAESLGPWALLGRVIGDWHMRRIKETQLV